MNKKPFKRILAFIFSLLLMSMLPVSTFAKANVPKAAGDYFLNSLTDYGYLVGRANSHNKGDYKYMDDSYKVHKEKTRDDTIVDMDNEKGVLRKYNPKTDKITSKTLAQAKKDKTLNSYTNPNMPDEDDPEYQDDSLGMCGDAFESFTKAVNKFYATVKTLIEQVLPKPTDYIPEGWSWASKFAQAFGAIGISLCFIFWGIGYLKSNARFLRDRNFNTIMLPFVRAGVAAALSASAFDLVQNILQGGLSLVSTIAKTQLPGKSTGEMSLESMQKVANDIGSLGLKKLLLWVEIMLATVGVKLMMFVIVGFVIVKFFKMFIYAAVAPLPIASLAGENTQQHAFSYLKALLGVILECLVICMALELFLHGIFTPAGEPIKRLIPEISGETDNGEILMGYIENVLAWMFATTAIVFGSDRLVSKAFGN